MVRKRSWPAVSQICSFTRLPSSSIVRILKSMPIVVMKEGVKESSLKRRRQQDLPTPESPIRRSLIYVRERVWLACWVLCIEVDWGRWDVDLDLGGDVQGSHSCVFQPS